MIDPYTKVMLTIIAGCLSVLAINSLGGLSIAQDNLQYVQICDSDGNCAKLVDEGGTYSLPVASQ